MASHIPTAPRGQITTLSDIPARVKGDRRRVVFALSSGGHLAQAMTLRPWWEQLDRVWVTFDTPDAISLLERERTIWCYRPTTRHLGNLIRNTWLAWRTLRRYRPDVVVSTGAAVAFPYFLVAKLLRIPTVYVEVYDRISTRTLTGRLCHPISDLFLVQWPEQVPLYRDSVNIGPLL